MSYTDFQANKVQQLLASAFQHQYKEIPESYKQNYYFEQFLFEAAEVYTLIKRYEKVCDEFNKADISFFMQKEEGGLVSVMNYFIKDRGILDKRNIQIITTEDGTVIFFKDFDLNRGGKEKEKGYQEKLTMQLGQREDQVLLDYTIKAKWQGSFYQCQLNSVFTSDGNEILRKSSAVHLDTGEVVFAEDFALVENILENNLQKEGKPRNLSILDISSGKIHQTVYQQEGKEIYAGKCLLGDEERYAVCFKPTGFVNEAYQKSFESISPFGAPGLNLAKVLDDKDTPWVVEITKEEYENLTAAEKKESDSKLIKSRQQKGKR